MPDHITIDDLTRTVHVRSHGAVSIEDIRLSLATVQEVQRTKSYERVLVDAREQQSMPSSFDLYKLFTTIQPTSLRIAVLVNRGQRTAEDIKFIETLASNRGIQIRMFAYERKARRWLSTPVRNPVKAVGHRRRDTL